MERILAYSLPLKAPVRSVVGCRVVWCGVLWCGVVILQLSLFLFRNLFCIFCLL